MSILLTMLFLSMVLINFIVGKVLIKNKSGYNVFGRSAASAEAQSFAASTCGELMVKSTLPVLFVTVAALGMVFIFYDYIAVEVIVLFTLAVGHMFLYALIIMRTESELRKHFDENGKAKSDETENTI